MGFMHLPLEGGNNVLGSEPGPWQSLANGYGSLITPPYNCVWRGKEEGKEEGKEGDAG